MVEHSFLDQFITDLHASGVRPGGLLMVHSSLKSLGQVPGGAESIIRGLLDALGPEGTLLMPALSYETVQPHHPIFDIKSTPSCVGMIPEIFRLRSGTQRSMHPTHSVCGVGPLAHDLLTTHIKDSTPCGPNSPFHRLPDFDGQILMLGCGLLPNTSMHAIEEIAEVPYLFNPPIIYTLSNENGDKFQKSYVPHNFMNRQQRYDRVVKVVSFPYLRIGSALKAKIYLIEAQAMKDTALKVLQEKPCFFVDEIEQI